MAVLAAASVDPTTFGTLTGAGPEETTKPTALPRATLAPAAGLCLITCPAGTVALFSVVTVPTARPAPVMALLAAASVDPTTFGTLTVAGADTVIGTVTLLPLSPEVLLPLVERPWP
jgi:hypothetical protein